MRSRNVIISLLFVLLLLGFTVIKIRYWEPKGKLTLRRNPSRIEYLPLALCRMDCYQVSANDIMELLRTGAINDARTKKDQRPFPLFAVEGFTRKRIGIGIMIIQSGRVARIKDCYRTDGIFVCNCPDDLKDVVSYLNEPVNEIYR